MHRRVRMSLWRVEDNQFQKDKVLKDHSYKEQLVNIRDKSFYIFFLISARFFDQNRTDSLFISKLNYYPKNNSINSWKDRIQGRFSHSPTALTKRTFPSKYTPILSELIRHINMIKRTSLWLKAISFTTPRPMVNKGVFIFEQLPRNMGHLYYPLRFFVASIYELLLARNCLGSVSLQGYCNI